MTTAFLFPGQGAQFAGMGKDIAEAYPAAREIFEQANEVLGYDLRKFCFQGPKKKLDSTVLSQPAIFTTSAAILESVRNEGTDKLKPEVTAGLSLGEYTALYAAGLISFEDGLKLVQRRAEGMQAASDATEGAMVSIIGLDKQKVSEICDRARGEEVLEAVNFNCPGQIVISGGSRACQRASELAEGAGAVRVVPLAVAGAFHTQMMSTAASALAEMMQECRICQPGRIKTIANINAEYYQNADKIAEGLIKQLTHPTLWQQCMEQLLSDGIRDFYEIGPGRTLTGLMRRISRKTRVVNLSSAGTVKELLRNL